MDKISLYTLLKVYNYSANYCYWRTAQLFRTTHLTLAIGRSLELYLSAGWVTIWNVFLLALFELLLCMQKTSPSSHLFVVNCVLWTKKRRCHERLNQLVPFCIKRIKWCVYILHDPTQCVVVGI